MKELVEPTLDILENLLRPGNDQDNVILFTYSSV